ncbi:MAG TPA: hypothetical protein VN736_01790 [Candidatus Limnocylindrales bacterium]|nr:hypothetical protein [Candidatus Limnocylindrales bacterium]
MVAEEAESRELMFNRFRRLLRELMNGETSRNCFQAWEVELLVDVQNCDLPARRRTELLRQYERAVDRQLQRGPGPPMRLSEFLVMRAARRGEQAV